MPHAAPSASLCGVILAGGRGARMGGDKHLALLEGKPLLRHVMERMSPQVAHLAIAGDHSSLQQYGVPVLPDAVGLKGPVAGLHSALLFALERNAGLITVPCDTPFLPRRLAAMFDGTRIAIPRIDGQALWVVSYWPLSQLQVGLRYLNALAKDAAPTLRQVYIALDAAQMPVPAQQKECFIGINTPEALSKAAAQLKRPERAHRKPMGMKE
ncbi:MAG: NTP transferase domain-containing protein [Pseudomonadota bacterium]